MSGNFIYGLNISFQIIGQMGVVVLAGYLMVKYRWLSQTALDNLTKILIDGIVPCVFIVSMVRGLNRQVLTEGAPIIIVVFLWMIIPFLVCKSAYSLIPNNNPREDDAAIAMTMIQNGIYLPLPVALAMVSSTMADEAAIYVSMAVFPSLMIQWTLGINLLAGMEAPSWKKRLKFLINPPLLALLTGAILSLVPGMKEAAHSDPSASLLLKILFSSMDFIGEALSPLAMIMLGAFIGSSSMKGRFKIRHLMPLIGFRLLLVPAMVVFAFRLNWLTMPALASFVLVIESAAPPATNHAIVARRYHGEWELVASLQLVVHAVALVTLPLWMSLAISMFPLN